MQQVSNKCPVGEQRGAPALSSLRCTSKTPSCQKKVTHRHTPAAAFATRTLREHAAFPSPAPARPLTQLRVRQLGDVPHDAQEVGAEPPVGVQEQEAELPVPLVCALHAVLRGHVEAPLWAGQTGGWGSENS